MVEQQPIEIVKRPVKVPETEIIRASPNVIKREVSLSLQKTGLRVTIPPGVTPLPEPVTTPSVLPFAPSIQTLPGVNGLIINIETSGFNPLKNEIISIGYQDPLLIDEPPKVIIKDSEAEMLRELFGVIEEFGYNQLIGYGLSFDFRFIVVKAMKHGIPCKQFADMELYDLMQAVAQVKFKFVYFPQRALKLSDVADFFWGYPKPFTDLEMLKYWKLGRIDKVIEFTSSQITRTLLLYSLFRGITETSFSGLGSGTTAIGVASPTTNTPNTVSLLTIPEAQLSDTWTAKCPKDLSEHKVPINVSEFTCPIDKTVIKRP